jgi:hypothetical protein
MKVLGNITSGVAKCHKCMISDGYKRKDDGAHTARIAHCMGCDTAKPLLPMRHWVKAH